MAAIRVVDLPGRATKVGHHPGLYDSEKSHETRKAVYDHVASTIRLLTAGKIPRRRPVLGVDLARQIAPGLRRLLDTAN